MLSQNRNLSQKLVVEEHIDRMRTYFSGNVTSEAKSESSWTFSTT